MALGHLHGLGGLGDLRAQQLVGQVGHHDQGDEPRHQGRQGPAAPGDGHLEIPRQLLGQGVRGHGREEHGAGDAVHLVGRERQEGAHLLRAGIARVAAVGPGQGGHDGHDDAPATGGVAGNGRREHQVRGRQAIAEAQGPPTQQRHEGVGDAGAKAGLDEAPGDEEGQHDEPDDHVHEAAHGVRDAERARQRRHGYADHGHGAHGQGLHDDASDGGDEDGEEVETLHPVGLALGLGVRLGLRLRLGVGFGLYLGVGLSLGLGLGLHLEPGVRLELRLCRRFGLGLCRRLGGSGLGGNRSNRRCGRLGLGLRSGLGGRRRRGLPGRHLAGEELRVGHGHHVRQAEVEHQPQDQGGQGRQGAGPLPALEDTGDGRFGHRVRAHGEPPKGLISCVVYSSVRYCEEAS